MTETKQTTPPPVDGPKEIAVPSKGRVLIERIARWSRRIALALAAILPLFFIIAALGTRWGWWDVNVGIKLLPASVGVKLIALTLCAGVISLLLTLLCRRKAKGIFVSALAILIPVGALVSLGAVKSKFERLPAIHDITTDTQNVPTFSKTIMDLRAQTKGVNSVEYVGKKDQRDAELYSVLQTRAYPQIRPLVLSAKPEQAFGQALATASQSGWTIHTEDIEAGVIEATDTSFWYGFKDDIVIRIHAGEGGGTIIDIRSVSRVGQSDLGANAARILEFIKSLK